MKRLALPTFVAAYTIFGVALLFSMRAASPPPGWKIVYGEGDLIWNAKERHMKVVVRSERFVLNTPEANLDRFEIIREIPEATVMLKVTGGNPSQINHLMKADGGIILINPNGIIVGRGGVVDLGNWNILSTLDIGMEEFRNDDFPIPRKPFDSIENSIPFSAGGNALLLGNFLPQNDLQSSAVELKTHGNVYALAINKEGKIRATGNKDKQGRVILTAPADLESNTAKE